MPTLHMNQDHLHSSRTAAPGCTASAKNRTILLSLHMTGRQLTGGMRCMGSLLIASRALSSSSALSVTGMPPGPFSVGVTTMQFDDASRVDPTSGGPRRLQTELWYPADKRETEGLLRNRFSEFLARGVIPGSIAAADAPGAIGGYRDGQCHVFFWHACPVVDASPQWFIRYRKSASASLHQFNNHRPVKTVPSSPSRPHGRGARRDVAERGGARRAVVRTLRGAVAARAILARLRRVPRLVRLLDRVPRVARLRRRGVRPPRLGALLAG